VSWILCCTIVSVMFAAHFVVSRHGCCRFMCIRLLALALSLLALWLEANSPHRSFQAFAAGHLVDSRGVKATVLLLEPRRLTALTELMEAIENDRNNT
jgi:hypothetical protein